MNYWDVVELQRRFAQLKDLERLYLERREHAVAQMHALLANSSYQPLEKEAGAAFDYLSQMVRGIDAYMPQRKAATESAWAEWQQADREWEAGNSRRREKRLRSRQRADERRQKQRAELMAPVGVDGNRGEVVRWKDWRSDQPSVELPVPIHDVEDEDAEALASGHTLSTEIDRRAWATMRYSPWAIRNRYRSRRYEGFGKGRRW
jgi:hypothetical protein